jgi:molybdenum cofactor guanylyltransferase
LALIAAKKAVVEEKFKVQSMIEKLQGVRYVSTLLIKELDPDLKTFFNINTPNDLEQAKSILKPRKRGQYSKRDFLEKGRKSCAKQ